MKIPEHITLSVLLAQFAVQPELGLGGTALMVAAGCLPDLDGAAIVCGWKFYARHHRILGHGILVTVPVPEADALPVEEAEAAIAEATRLAEAAGVHGKAVTPYVLAKVLDLTGGRSQQANIAALVNNAHVAAQIAVAASTC